MKTAIKKTAKVCFALLISASFLFGCQEDIAEPTAGVPAHKVAPPN